MQAAADRNRDPFVLRARFTAKLFQALGIVALANGNRLNPLALYIYISRFYLHVQGTLRRTDSTARNSTQRIASRKSRYIGIPPVQYVCRFPCKESAADNCRSWRDHGSHPPSYSPHPMAYLRAVSFPAYHVRWWLVMGENVTRVLNSKACGSWLRSRFTRHHLDRVLLAAGRAVSAK